NGFDAVRSGSRIYGLGAADDKGGIAAMLLAAGILADLDEPLPLAASVHGKSGGARGSLAVFAGFPELQAAIYLHPAETGAGLRQVKHASQGILDAAVTVRGWRGPLREINTPESADRPSSGDALAYTLDCIHVLRSALPDCDVHVGRIHAGEAAGTVPVLC